MAEQRDLQILYVEDNAAVREMLGALLSTAAGMVVSTSSAEEALAALDVQRFDVLITDIALPALSGIELARRARERQPGLWVIVSSGYAWTAGLDALAPRVAWLGKPPDFGKLEALLARIAGELN